MFCLTVLMLNLTPGPDTAFIVGRTLAQGRRAGVVSALGISAGCCLHALASAVGLSALLVASATAFVLVKLAGGAYLIYLGINLLRARQANVPTAAVSPRLSPARTLPTIFRQAMLTNLLNPKVVLFFLSFFPQFVSPTAADKTGAFLALGAVFLIMSTIWGLLTANLAGALRTRVGSSAAVQRWIERTVGAAFIALGIRLAWARA